MKRLAAAALALLFIAGCGAGTAQVADGPGVAYALERMEYGADATGAVFACGEDIYTVNMNFGADGAQEYSLVRNGAGLVYEAGDSAIRLACGGASGLWLSDGGTLRQLSFAGEQLLSLELSCDDMLCLGDELYVLRGGRVEVLGSGGEALRGFDVGEGAGIVRGGDGHVYVTLPADDGLETYPLEAGDSASIVLPQVTAAYPGSAEYPLLCLRGGMLYGLDAAGALEPLADLDECGVMGLRCAEALGDGRILVLDRLGPGLLSEHEAASPGAEPATLRLGTVGDSLSSIVEGFNARSEGVVVREIDYTRGGTVSVQDALTLLAADIASGNGPDMLLTTNLPVHSYIRRGYMLELSGLIDTEDIVMAEALEVSGGLYCLARGFGVETYAGLASDFGEAEGWTLEQYLEAEAGLRPGAVMFYNATRELFLRMTCASYMQEAIDWESGECSFDTEGFVQLLDTAARMTEYPEETGFGYAPPAELLRTGSEYVTLCYVGSVTRMAAFEAEVGERVCFVGMPAPDGGNGSVMNVNGAVGVMAYTEQRAACADFLEYLLKGYDPSELDYERNSSMPMYRPYLEELTSRAQADGKLEGEDIARFYEFLGLVRYSNLSDAETLDIILEEASAIGPGTRTAAEAAALIQDRIQTRVAEQS